MKWFDNFVLPLKPSDVTFAIIKPDADAHTRNQIIQIILSNGFKLLRMERADLSKTEVDALYAEHREKEFYPRLKAFMLSGEVTLLAISGPDVQKKWREIIMPNIRHTLRKPDSATHENLVHGSDSEKSAMFELLYFFG